MVNDEGYGPWVETCPVWLIVAMMRSMLGEIYPEIRSITAFFDKETRDIHIKCYLDKEVEESDKQTLANIVSKVKYGWGEQFNHAHFDVIETHDFKVLSSDKSVYHRKEGSW